jgi:DNA-binding CsgD family transcriptional regulator
MLQPLVTQAYAAAFDDTLWPAWTERMVDAFGGAGGNLLVVEPASRTVERRLFVRADPDAISAYERDGLARLDPQVPHLLRLKGRAVYTDTDHIDPKDASAARHADFLARRIGWSHYLTGIGSVGNGATNVMAGLSIHRCRGSDPVPVEDRERLAAVLPQINDAMALGFTQSALLVDAYWQGHCGAAREPTMLLDEKGRVLRKSDALEELVKRADAFSLHGGHPVAGTATAQKQLDAAIARAVRLDQPVRGTVQLPSSIGDAALVANVQPILWSSRMMAPAEAAAILSIIDPTRRRSLDGGAWAHAFGFTNREIDLALLLLDGHSVLSIAEIRQREVATIRTQLRSVFSKTGTARQADLIHLLTRVE